MVEPLPDVFEKLKANYKDIANIKFENSGISNVNTLKSLYYIKDVRDDEPDWYDQVSSFDRDSFYKNISVVPELLDRIGILDVNLISFDELMEKHNMPEVDLLMIDTEGYDFNVLQSIDFKKYHPKIIIFETDWLCLYDFKLAKKMLLTNGYKLFFSGVDCIAIR